MKWFVFKSHEDAVKASQQITNNFNSKNGTEITNSTVIFDLVDGSERAVFAEPDETLLEGVEGYEVAEDQPGWFYSGDPA